MTARLTPVILIVLAGLVGCATEQGQIGKPFSPAGRKALRINRTTRAEARLFLGEPRTITPAPDGRETWRYEHSRISALSLPLIGGIRATQTPHVLMTLRFQYGVLSECEFFQENYRSRGMEIRTATRVSGGCER
jgi:hypothetical protein